MDQPTQASDPLLDLVFRAEAEGWSLTRLIEEVYATLPLHDQQVFQYSLERVLRERLYCVPITAAVS